MNTEERIALAAELLIKDGLDEKSAKEWAEDSTDTSLPESLAFSMIAKYSLAPIHTSDWVEKRAKRSDDTGPLFNRLLNSGASKEDLAAFARAMQWEYMSRLGFILSNVGYLPGILKKDGDPFEFRVFTVDEDDNPIRFVDGLETYMSDANLDPMHDLQISKDSGKIC